MADEKPPAPAETAAREQEEKDRKAREDAEQAQLPYKWTQTIRDVEVTIPVPGNLKGRDLDVVLAKDKIKVAVKGQEAIIEVRHPPISNKYQTTTQRSAEVNPYVNIGPIPPPYPHRRILLDPRNHPNTTRQRNRHPPRQSQQDELVGARGDDGTQDRCEQDHARELESERFGRADEGNGGENDV